VICNIHENLTWHNRFVQLVPRLALSWETPDNSNSWIFHLRQGVSFHDGTPFNAQAVKAHFDRLKDPATKSNRSTKMKDVATIDVVDEHTVQFHMVKPFSLWPVRIRDAFGVIESPKAVEEANARREAEYHKNRETDPNAVRPEPNGFEYSRKPSGTGPFMFVEQEPDQYLRLRRNPNYWDAANIHVDEIEFRPIREPTTRLIVLEQGGVDVCDVLYSHVEVAEREKQVVLKRAPFLCFSYIVMNCMKPPFSDIRVRHAANHGVDRQAIVKYGFRGNADPAYGVLPPSLPPADPDLKNVYPFDLDKARWLMKQAGLGGGVDLEMWSKDDAADTALGVLLADQLARIGFRISIKRFDRNIYWGKFDPYQTPEGKWYPTKEGVFDMAVSRWVGGEHAFGYLDPLFRSTSSSNMCFYRNLHVDSMLDDTLKISDETQQTALLRKIERQIVEDAPCIFTYFPQLFWGMSPRLKDMHVHPAGEYEFQGVTLGGVEGLA
jgi:ABC-type transport system substrate-binding protein